MNLKKELKEESEITDGAKRARAAVGKILEDMIARGIIRTS